MSPKVVIFDVGNVLVNWSPLEVINSIFPNVDPKALYQQLRPIWLNVNLGKITEEEAINQCHREFNLPVKSLKALLDKYKSHQQPLPGSIELLDKLYKLEIPLFAITDNTKEIIEYHTQYSLFPKYFKEIIVSAEIGVLKPDSKIYNFLLKKYNLDPTKCIFIDDHPPNVIGAINVGLNSFQFKDFTECSKELEKFLGVELRD